MHLLGDFPGVFLDGGHVLRGDVPGGDDAGGVPGVDSGQLDMLHHRGHKGVLPVADGIGLALGGMVQEAVNEDGPVRRHSNRRPHIVGQALVVVHHLHAPASQHIGGAHHHGIPYTMGNFQGLLHGGGHAGLGHGNPQLVHHGPEQISVLRHVDHGGGGAQDAHAILLQLRRQVQGGLPAELGDDAQGLLLFVDAQHVLQGQGLEVELVRGVVVRGHGLGIAVHHDGLETQLLQGQGGMDAAIVELDALADAVGAAA